MNKEFNSVVDSCLDFVQAANFKNRNYSFSIEVTKEELFSIFEKAGIKLGEHINPRNTKRFVLTINSKNEYWVILNGFSNDNLKIVLEKSDLYI